TRAGVREREKLSFGARVPPHHRRPRRLAFILRHSLHLNHTTETLLRGASSSHDSQFSLSLSLSRRVSVSVIRTAFCVLYLSPPVCFFKIFLAHTATRKHCRQPPPRVVSPNRLSLVPSQLLLSPLLVTRKDPKT